MDHDRLFKQLLRTFFLEFLELFFPAVIAYLDRSSIEFLDKEIFTDLTAGDRHEVDLVVKTRFKGGEACFLVHVETQSQAQEEFPWRMFQYFARIHEQFRLPTYPIVLFSYDSPLREAPTGLQIDFPDHRVLDFQYRVVQLNRLNWRDYVRNANPVAAALMTRMKIAAGDRPKVKLECLRLIVTLKLDLARQSLVREFMAAYLTLNAAELAAYNAEVEKIERIEREAIMQFVDQWEEIGEARGLAKGVAQGVVEGEVSIVLKVLRRRLPDITPAMEQVIRSLPREKLELLADVLLEFKSIGEIEEWVRRA